MERGLRQATSVRWWPFPFASVCVRLCRLIQMLLPCSDGPDDVRQQQLWRTTQTDTDGHKRPGAALPGALHPWRWCARPLAAVTRPHH